MTDRHRTLLGDFGAVSFDCYGTLVDWQSGILSVLRPMLRAAGQDRSDAWIVSAFAEHERRIEAEPYRPYREVLGLVALAMLGPGASPEAAQALPDSLASWRPFPETDPSLIRLARRFPLAIASNVDNDMFLATRRGFTAPLATIVTAEDVRSYKPVEAHFKELAGRLSLPLSRILHVAESRYHDIEPASRLGFGTVWINRTGEAPSASGPGSGVPNWTFRSLTALADAMDREATQGVAP